MHDAFRVVVAGTDTGVGKTVLSALLTLASDALYWKPVQSGVEEETDRRAVLRMAELAEERALAERYVLRRPMSPDQSARADGVTIERDALALPSHEGPLIVETVMVPMSDGLLQIEVIGWWGLPVVLAARSGLGTLNHTLLSIEALRSRSIDVRGIVLVGPEHRENVGSLRRWTDVPIVGAIPPMPAINRAALREIYRSRFVPIDRWGGGAA